MGSRRMAVRVLDESAGGLRVASDDSPEFEVDAVGRLTVDDHSVAVRVVYIEEEGQSVRIGLQRTATKSDASALWKAAHAETGVRRTNPKILLIGLTVGLLLGVALQQPQLRKKVPGLTEVLRAVAPRSR